VAFTTACGEFGIGPSQKIPYQRMGRGIITERLWTCVADSMVSRCIALSIGSGFLCPEVVRDGDVRSQVK
jgi:hypothetical protein